MNTRSRAPNAATFVPADMNAVTHVGAPWYASGVHMWNGTAATLKREPAWPAARPRPGPGAGPQLPGELRRSPPGSSSRWRRRRARRRRGRTPTRTPPAGSTSSRPRPRPAAGTRTRSSGRGEGQDLQGEEDHDEVVGRREQGHPGRGEQEQRVVLAAVLPARSRYWYERGTAEHRPRPGAPAEGTPLNRSAATMSPKTVAGCRLADQDQSSPTRPAAAAMPARRDDARTGRWLRVGAERVEDHQQQAPMPTRMSSGSDGPEHQAARCRPGPARSGPARAGSRRPPRPGRGPDRADSTAQPAHRPPLRQVRREVGPAASPPRSQHDRIVRSRGRFDPVEERLGEQPRWNQDRHDAVGNAARPSPAATGRARPACSSVGGPCMARW